MRQKFADAKRQAPSVIYIDEIDAIAGNRKNSRGELEKRILTELLIQMDWFETRGQVLVVGSTNLIYTAAQLVKILYTPTVGLVTILIVLCLLVGVIQQVGMHLD